MHFDPFHPDPNNSLLAYVVDTGGIPVSDIASEFIINYPDTAAEILQRVRDGDPYHAHTTRDGIKMGFAWSESRQEVIWTKVAK